MSGIYDMAESKIYALNGLNLGVNPLLQSEGDFIRLVNVDTDPIGAKKKRPGYVTYLGTPDNNAVTALFNWTKNDGTTFWNYRVSGGILYYSTQGTGAWTVCGNGTLTDGARPGYTVLENTLILGDGTAATRHTTSGTDFTNTTSAPVANYFAEYQNRVWAGGTGSDTFYSNVGTPTDWVNDSSSIAIPGAGRLSAVFKTADRLVNTKNSGLVFQWDGDTLRDLATRNGPAFHYGIGDVEGFKFWLNRSGVYGFGGARPEIYSTQIEKQIYNDAGGGIQGGTFDLAPSLAFKKQYHLVVGSVKDDLTNQLITNGILNYHYSLNQWSNYDFKNLPTALGSYTTASGSATMIFGDSTGQCYTYGGTATSDNGNSIEAIMEYVHHGGVPHLDKTYQVATFTFNPGCQAKIQVSLSDSFTYSKRIWKDVGPIVDGVAEFKFPEGSEAKLCFVRIYEASRDTRFTFYGMTFVFEPIKRT